MLNLQFVIGIYDVSPFYFINFLNINNNIFIVTDYYISGIYIMLLPKPYLTAPGVICKMEHVNGEQCAITV